ncbi:hypothetical protein L1D28_10620 [Vibrio chagasii]|uniref:hypothetical protein n=1 Tax=Vibrio chagasii TaxID=170679 RepID=UPI001EFEB3F5|nr:hypothetical protein [Vibrio chagasii]MCG9562056.1 hypothetical protein [Vibrio chagasii]
MSASNNGNNETSSSVPKKRDYTFLQNLLLLCLGSLIFAGITEAYKSDLTTDKSLVKEYYRPLRDVTSTCMPLQNQLFLKHGELAGNYKLILDEMGHMFTNLEIANSSRYQVYPMSLMKAHSSVKLELKQLSEKVSKCRADVYQKYEELALATGTYGEYKKLSEAHFRILNKGHKARKAAIPQEIKEIDPNVLVQMMRELTVFDLSTDEAMVLFKERINSIAIPVIEYEVVKMESEQSAFKENNRFHDEVTSIFLNEISARNSPSILSRIF